LFEPKGGLHVKELHAGGRVFRSAEAAEEKVAAT
jgi:hypothetical protein